MTAVEKDQRYHIRLEDPVTNEALGLVLTNTRPFSLQSSNPMAARQVQDRDYSAFDQWSIVQQDSWHHGRGLEIWDQGLPERYYDSESVDTRIRDQLILAPRVIDTELNGGSLLHCSDADMGNISYVACELVGDGNYNVKWAQQFTPATTHTCKQVAVKLAWKGGSSSHTVTLRIETDNSDEPSGALADFTATADAIVSGRTFKWYTFDFGVTGFTLTAGTNYWLVLNITDGDSNDKVEIRCAYDADGNPYAGYCKYYSESWNTSEHKDIYFWLLSEGELAGTVQAFAYFDASDSSNTGLYCAAGDTVYKWNSTNGIWVTETTITGKTITDLEVYADYIFAACSDGTLYRKAGTNSSSWADYSATQKATHMLVYKGYLYAAYYDSSNNENRVYYTVDLSTWEGPWAIGDAFRGERITALAGLRAEIYAITTHGLYALGPDVIFVPEEWQSWDSQWHADNGLGSTGWSDGKLYIPVGSSLFSYDGNVFSNIGLNRDAGLPAARAGKIKSIVSTINWLIAAVDADSGVSGIYAWKGLEWHELVRIQEANQPCRAMWYDTSVSPHRLWFGWGKRVSYIEFPDTTDNPYEYSGTHYELRGSLTTPRFSADMLMVDKDLRAVYVRNEITDTSVGSIKVEYKVDGFDAWTELDLDTGGVTSVNGYMMFPFSWEDDYVVYPKTTGDCGTVKIWLDDASLISVGDWVRINDETRQVKSVDTDENYIILQTPLSYSPAVGRTVYASKPVCREIQLRITLETLDDTITPKVRAWWMEYMPMYSDRYAGSFEAAISDSMTDLAGHRIVTGDQAAALLYSFAQRATPIYLYDLNGERHTVKLTRLHEIQSNRREGARTLDASVVRTFAISFLEISRKESGGHVSEGTSYLYAMGARIPEYQGQASEVTTFYKLDKSDGSVVWDYALPNGTSTIEGEIALDSDENFYVTYRPTSEDFHTLAKYTKARELVWTAEVPMGQTYGLDVDSNGNIYVSGFITGSGQTNLCKLNAAGEILWTRSGATANEFLEYLCVDSDGYVWLVYTVVGESVPSVIRKYDSDGTLVQTIELPGATADVRFEGLAVSGDYVYVAIQWTDDWDKNGAAKFTKSGTLVWVTDPCRAATHGIAVDSDGNVYVAQLRAQNDSGATVTGVKLDSDGNLVWEVDCKASGLDVKVDLTGVYFMTEVNSASAFMHKYDFHGNLLWTRTALVTGYEDYFDCFVLS